MTLLSLSLSGAGAKERSGVVSTDFDGKASGARYIGMGQTGTAHFGMPQSPLWNPASLQDLIVPSFVVDLDAGRRSSLDDDILLKDVSLRGRKLTYMAVAAPSAALFFRPLASFKERTVTDPTDPANNFRDEHLKVNQIGVSASQLGEKGHTVGVTLSYLNARRAIAQAATGQPPILEVADGNGFSLDAGFRVRRDQFTYGAAFFNIPGIVYWNLYEPDQLPVLMRLGTSVHPSPLYRFVFDYEKRFYRGGLFKPEIWHVGGEWSPLPWLELRAGLFGEDLDDPKRRSKTGGLSLATESKRRIDLAVRHSRFLDKDVYNYFVSVVFPFSQEGVGPKRNFAKNPRSRDRGF